MNNCSVSALKLDRNLPGSTVEYHSRPWIKLVHSLICKSFLSHPNHRGFEVTG